MQSRAGRLKAIKNQINPLIGYPSLDINFAAVNEILDPRITFSRDSNATVVGSDGLIQYAPHNLLTYSENFDNAVWNKGVSVTIVTNSIAAPDGTSTADKAIYSAAAIAPSQTISSSTIAYTISAYIKSGNTSFCRLRVGAATGGGGTSFSSYFNLSNGTVSSTGTATADFGSITPVITQAANGWYRISISFTVLSATTSITYGIVAAQTSGGSSAVGDEIYIWGAQLNEGSLQPYYTTSVKNLLGYNQNFENVAWTKSNSSIDVTPVMGPLGFVGAEKLVEDTATNTHLIQQTPTYQAGTIYTHSVYAKAGERSFLQIRTTSTSTFSASFDLVNGTYSQLAANTTASITSVGNGWFRCSITFTALASAAGATRLGVMLNDTTQSYTGDGTSGIYIFGAQLSDSASLDLYSYNFGAAPTSTAYYGPRFDYDPVTLAPKGLLIEEQQTNLLTYSEQFDNAVWVKSNSTVTANTTIAPDGTTTSDKLVEDTATNTHLIQQTPTFTLNAIYTQSVYAKAGERTVVQLRSTSLTTFSASFDLSNGTYSQVTANTTASITNVGNGWYRCTITFTAGASGATAARIALMQNATTQSYTGDGTSGIYLWGAQLEAGAFPTSYIPTTSASVTRAADNASMTGTNFSSWYNQSEGTFAVGFDMYYATVTSGAFPRAISCSNGTNSNLIDIQSAQYANENFAIDDLGIQQCSINLTQFSANTSGKVAGAYALNSFQAAGNGVLGTADNLGTVPTVNQMQIGNRWDLARPMSGHIQSIKYYPRRLANGDLQAITS